MATGTATAERGTPAHALRVREVAAAVRLPGGWTRRLLVVVVGLSVISLATQVVRYGLGMAPRGLNSLERWFYVDREMGVPAWFSAVLLFVVGERLWHVATAVRARDGRWHRHWRLLAVVFVLLSVDELTEIHEQTIRPVRTLLHLSGALSFAWVVLAVPLLLVLGAVLLPFLRALPRGTRDAFLLSAVVYVGGAVGLEMLGAVIFDRSAVTVVTTTVADGVTAVTQAQTVGGLLYAVETFFEEGFEMLGLVLFVGAVTSTLRRAVADPLQPRPRGAV